MNVELNGDAGPIWVFACRGCGTLQLRVENVASIAASLDGELDVVDIANAGPYR